jgi:hypothetical protein
MLAFEDPAFRNILLGLNANREVNYRPFIPGTKREAALEEDADRFQTRQTTLYMVPPTVRRRAVRGAVHLHL